MELSIDDTFKSVIHAVAMNENRYQFAKRSIYENVIDWLVELSEKESYGRFITYKRPNYLQLHSYVGYLESPCGEGIEIL